MPIFFRYSLLCFVALGLLVIGMLYSISSDLSKKDIRSLVISMVESSIPGIDIQIKDIDYTIGLSLNFNIHEVDMKLKDDKPGREIFFAKKVFIQVPLWSYIFRSNWEGMDIIISEPKINYYEYGSGLSNWKGVIQSLQGDHDFYQAFSQIRDFGLISDHVVLFYQTKEDYRGEISIDDLFFRIGFQHGKVYLSSHGNIGFLNESKRAVSSTVSLDGEFSNISELTNKKLNTNLNISFINNKTATPFFSVPDFKGSVNFQKKRGGVLLAKLNLNGQDDMANSIRANISLSNNTMRIDGIDAYFKLSSIMKNNYHSRVQEFIANSTLRVTGKAIGFLYHHWNIKFRLVEPIEIKRSNGFVDLFWEGSLSGDRSILRLLFKTNRGKVWVSLKTATSNIFLPIPLGYIEPWNIKVNLYDVKVLDNELIFLNKFFYGYCINNKYDFLSMFKRFKLSGSNILLSGKNVFVGRGAYNFKGRIVLGKDSILVEDFLANVGRGKAKLKIFSKILSHEVMTHFNIDMKKFPLSKISSLFPPPLKNMRGRAKVKLSGMLGCEKGNFPYEVKVSGQAFKGELREFDMDSFLMQKISKNKRKLKRGKANFTSDFKKFGLQGIFKNDQHRIKKIEYVGSSSGLIIKGKGSLFPSREKRRGGVILMVRDKKGNVKKHFKLSRLAYDYLKFPFLK